KVSPFGAFMDSVFDRWGEAIVYLGIAWGGVLASEDTVAILATAALGAAFMVSYTRAKSEGLGFSPGIGMAAIGVMPREIRLIAARPGLVVAGAPAHCSHPRSPRRRGDGQPPPPGRRSRDHRGRRRDHSHPADPSDPQPGRLGHHHHDPLKGRAQRPPTGRTDKNAT